MHALLLVINSHISLCSLSASGSEGDDAAPSVVSTGHFSLENCSVRHARDVLPQGEAHQKLMAFFNKHRPVDGKVRSDHIMLGACRESPTTQTSGSRSSLHRKLIIVSHRHSVVVVLFGRTWKDQRLETPYGADQRMSVLRLTLQSTAGKKFKFFCLKCVQTAASAQRIPVQFAPTALQWVGTLLVHVSPVHVRCVLSLEHSPDTSTVRDDYG